MCLRYYIMCSMQSINWKCSPHKLAELIKKLTPRQLQWIQDMGLQYIIDMPQYKLPLRLLLWLVKKVDCKSKYLAFRNRKNIFLGCGREYSQVPIW